MKKKKEKIEKTCSNKECRHLFSEHWNPTKDCSYYNDCRRCDELILSLCIKLRRRGGRNE